MVEKKTPTTPLIYVTGEKRKITFFLLFYSLFFQAAQGVAGPVCGRQADFRGRATVIRKHVSHLASGG